MLTSNSQCFAEALYYNLANEEPDCQAAEYQLWGSEEMEQEVEEQEMEEQDIPNQEMPEQEGQEVQGQEEFISSDEEVEVPVEAAGVGSLEVLVEVAGAGSLEICVEGGQEQAGEEDAERRGRRTQLPRPKRRRMQRRRRKAQLPRRRRTRRPKRRAKSQASQGPGPGEDEGTAAATAFPKVLLCG